MSLFSLSVAEIELSDEGIRYRQLSEWKSLRFDEITGCGYSKVRLEIGYIRLKHPVWPWRNLYFILDEPTQRGSSLIAFIRQRIGPL